MYTFSYLQHKHLLPTQKKTYRHTPVRLCLHGGNHAKGFSRWPSKQFLARSRDNGLGDKGKD